ncbi:MAG: hypothetical protein Q7T24_08570 [Deltaproteobacteria bacterium]|nr:hypothetical protein [Deltaproteobacteria bacterium]
MLDAIRKRRSIRAFLKRAVEGEKLREVFGHIQGCGRATASRLFTASLKGSNP